jgi:thymidylate kinase
MTRNNFIVLEGTDGVGKSTQAQKLCAYIGAHAKRPVVLIKDPGETALAVKIKALIKPENDDDIPSPMTTMLLFAAARSDMMRLEALPALNSGKIVVMDRFTRSSLAYWHAGFGIIPNYVMSLNQMSSADVFPRTTLWLDMPPEKALARISSEKKDWIEKRGMDFHMRVYHSYKDMYENYHSRMTRINADQPEQEVFNEILTNVCSEMPELYA